jgi:hypothetical protein
MRSRFGIRRWLPVLCLAVLGAACERKAVPFEVEDRPPQERGVAQAQADRSGHGSEADDRWGTGFEDDDTFGDTDALDGEEADEDEDRAAVDRETTDDGWATGFEDDDTFGDTDALGPDEQDETPDAQGEGSA